jgi:hypothetical protein
MAAKLRLKIDSVSIVTIAIRLHYQQVTMIEQFLGVGQHVHEHEQQQSGDAEASHTC